MCRRSATIVWAKVMLGLRIGNLKLNFNLGHIDRVGELRGRFGLGTEQLVLYW